MAFRNGNPHTLFLQGCHSWELGLPVSVLNLMKLHREWTALATVVTCEPAVSVTPD